METCVALFVALCHLHTDITVKATMRRTAMHDRPPRYNWIDTLYYVFERIPLPAIMRYEAFEFAFAIIHILSDFAHSKNVYMINT